MSQNQNNDYDCYLRRVGQPWTRGRAHHRLAMEQFLERERAQRGEVHRIAVPHPAGGDFIGWFRRINAIVCQYTDEYGQRVDVMMCASSTAAYANRIVDHY